jgi:hypothetical protein
MRHLLLTTAAVAALALGSPVGHAQSSNAPSGASEEQPNKGGKATAPANQGPAAKQAPGQGTPTSVPTNRNAQAPTAQPNGTAHPNNQAQQTTPEVPQQQQRTGQPALHGQAQPKAPSTTGENNTAPGNAGRQNAGTASSNQGNRSADAHARVQVTQQQRTQIHERIGHLHAQRLDRADFSLEVGVAVPRSVRVYTLPPEIVEVVPEYRGYDYILVGDDIVIVDPGSLQIVAVIPA